MERSGDMVLEVTHVAFGLRQIILDWNKVVSAERVQNGLVSTVETTAARIGGRDSGNAGSSRSNERGIMIGVIIKVDDIFRLGETNL